MPFTTDTVWRWWQNGSVHTAVWPTVGELGTIGDSSILEPIGEILSQIRRSKTDAKTSQKAVVVEAVLTASAEVLAVFELGRSDLGEAGSVAHWVTVVAASETSVRATLSAPETGN